MVTSDDDDDDDDDDESVIYYYPKNPLLYSLCYPKCKKNSKIGKSV